jgi:hypothetical protein
MFRLLVKNVLFHKKSFIFNLISFLFFLFFSVYCCGWHIGSSLDIKRDFLQCLDDLVDYIIANRQEE